MAAHRWACRAAAGMAPLTRGNLFRGPHKSTSCVWARVRHAGRALTDSLLFYAVKRIVQAVILLGLIQGRLCGHWALSVFAGFLVDDHIAGAREAAILLPILKRRRTW